MNPTPARDEREPWTTGQKWFSFGLVVAGLVVGGIAFRVIYETVTAVARPFMPHDPWTVVVSCEIAFVVLFGIGVLLAWRKAPAGAARGFFMGLLIVGSVVLNIWAARGNVPDMTVHLVVVCAFFAVLLSGKGAITVLHGGKIRADRITFGEWLAHPIHSFRLQRWMTTWGETSRKTAHARYMRLLYAVAIAQTEPSIGSGRGWRRNLPVTLRYQLSTGELPDYPDETWQADLARHVRDELNAGQTSLERTPPSDTGMSTERTPEGSTGETPNPSPEATGEASTERTPRRAGPREPDYTKRPTKATVAKMPSDGIELAKYVREAVQLGHCRPSIASVMKWFHCGDGKARNALTEAGFLGEDAAVITLEASGARA